MDREQEELQFLSFFGICKEAINITFRWSKIFTKITLTLILPLSLIFLAHDGFSAFISRKIMRNEVVLDATLEGTPSFDKEYDLISSEITTLWIIKIVYLTLSLVFSLLSTSAVVYTTACIYTGKDISFRKVMSVVPRVWKRLMVTFLWNFGIMFLYNMVFIIVLIILLLFFGDPHRMRLSGALVILAAMVIYLIGFVYMNMIWQLASVISVLEDTYGLQAMKRSKGLLKGKMGISYAMFLVFFLCMVGIQVVFKQKEVLDDWSVGVGGKIGYGILCLVLLTLLFVFGLTVQTVIYFVCKSYHHENIDKSSLAHHLEAYLGEYVPLTAQSIQLEQFDV